MKKYSIGINKQLSPFECYKTYIALKSHFKNEKYDFFEYQGRTNVGKKSYEKRKDKIFFEILSEKYRSKDIIQIFVSNHIKNGDFWVGEIQASDECIETWKKWKGKIQNFPYWFRMDCEKIFQHDMNKLFYVDSQSSSITIPHILRLVLQEDIMLETMIVLNSLLKFTDGWNQAGLKIDPMWNELDFRIQKYTPFLGNINKKKYKDITQKVLTESIHCDITISRDMNRILENRI